MLPQPADNASTTTRTADVAQSHYALTLRVIGQDLSQLFPRVLEIATDGSIFEARGESHPNPFEVIREGLLTKALKKIRGIEVALPTAPPESFTRRYGPGQIEHIDQLNRAQRSENFRRAENYSLPERLRTLGAIVDATGGRLKQLHKEADRFIVEYWDIQGQLKTAKLTTVILYRNQQQLDRQRRRRRDELWEGYDF